MSAWEYKVVYMDFRGRASLEGDEQFIVKEERRSSFARRVMNALGAEGWEMVGLQPLWPAETSYLIFKRPGVGDSTPPADTDMPAAVAGGEAAPHVIPAPAPNGVAPLHGQGPVMEF